MPEGDSVFRLAARLRGALDGRLVVSSDFRVPRHATADLAGRRVLGHETHGKHLLTRFEGGLSLHTHLRMDGSWTVLASGRRLPARVEPDVRLRILADDGTTAVGVAIPVVELVPTEEEPRAVGHLGPDPLRADWDPDEAARRVARDPSRAVLEAIRDQRNVAGLGNLWVNELCFLRGVHPDTPIGEVAVAPLLALAARTLRHSATEPAAHQITTGDRRRGRRHWVAGRASQPCLRCGTLIRGRTEHAAGGGEHRTWWCPHCQPDRSPAS